MIHPSTRAKSIKIMFYIGLVTFLMLSVSKTIFAQPGDLIDSLITSKNEFKKGEKIEFKVKLEKHTKQKSSNVRLVPTMSCACGDKDFYYELYIINDVKYPSKKKAFLIHNEKSDAQKCDCKSHFAAFYDNKKYFIPSINQIGKYMLIIQAHGFVMYSNIFTVND
jgi:hypothetical protein